MFEHHQNEVDNLLNQNIEFRRLYNKHQDLHKRVHEAEIGTAPLDDLTLMQLKKEKLWAKDRLSHIMESHLNH